MIQQDSKIAHAYALGIASLVLALFIPFTFLIGIIFKQSLGAYILSAGIPLIAIVVGVFGFIKSRKHSNPLTKSAKILSITSIIIGIILVAFNLYIFIKSAALAA